MRKKERIMARPRKTLAAPSLSPGEASYVIERLVADRRIASSDVTRYVGLMHQEIVDLEQRLHTLRTAATGTTASHTSSASGVTSIPAVTPRRRARKTASPEVQASRQLQGRYVSLIRQIPKYKRVQYQQIAKKRGREAAVTEMRRALGK
jgi:O6-methylguanine-DNA--protein-cysteine methyltransferase